jgi:hypothetical protein
MRKIRPYIFAVVTLLLIFAAYALGQVVSIKRESVLDFQGLASSPGNPSTGNGRVYYNTSTSLLTCNTPAGASCMPIGGGGTVTGSGVANQVAFWTSASAIGGDTGLTYVPGTKSFLATGGASSVSGLLSGPSALNQLAVQPGEVDINGGEANTNLVSVFTRHIDITAGGHFIINQNGVGAGLGLNGQAITLQANPGDLVLNSSSANVGVTVGTANRFNFPTATGSAGQFLQTNGANPQLLSWATASPSNVTIDVAAQTGAFFDTQQIGTATISNGSAIITAPSGTFKAADVGKNIVGFKTDGCNTGNLLQTDIPVLAETTILSFQSSTQVTANASASANGNCIFWGHPDDAAFTATDTIASTATQCPTINLPAKMGWIEQAHFIVSVPPCNVSAAATGGQIIGWGEVIRGQGKGSSVLFIAPNLNSNRAGCTGGPANNACFFGQQGQNLRDFQMTGGDQVNTTFGAAKVLFDFAIYDVLSNVIFNNYGSNDTNLTISTGSVVMWGADFSGVPVVNLNAESASNQTYLFSSAFQSNCSNTQEVSIAANSRVISTGTSYTPDPCINGVGHTEIRNNGQYWSYGDFFFNETSSNFVEAMFTNNSASAQAWFYGTTFLGSAGTNNLSQPLNNAAGTIYLSGTALNCGSSAPVVNTAAGASTIDGGGNVITGCQANPLSNPTSGVLTLTGNLSPIGTLSSSTQLIASRNTLLGVQTLLPTNNSWKGTTNQFEIRLSAYDSAAGASCSTNTTITWTINYTDATGTAQTKTATETITTNGGATGGDRLDQVFNIVAQSGTAITYSTTYAIGTGCSPGPSYAAQITLN